MTSLLAAPSRASVPSATRLQPGVAWQQPGDAFIARRLREMIAPGDRAGAIARAGGAAVAVVATCEGLSRIELFEGDEASLPPGVRAEEALRDVAALIVRCLSRWQPAAAHLPLDVTGTAFQVAVWKVLGEIRAGGTATYGDVAARLGRSPGSSRAIGQAVGANPVPVVVPCHRVLAAGGAIGGFACGLPMKRRLLKAEGVLA